MDGVVDDARLAWYVVVVGGDAVGRGHDVFPRFKLASGKDPLDAFGEGASMNRLERYIGLSVAKATAMTVLVLVILLVFLNLVDELDDLNKGNYTLEDAFLVAALSAPRYLFEVFPVAALIGSLLGLGGLAASSELVAMRAAGFSLRAIMAAVLKTGALMMIVVLAFGELFAPTAEQYAQQHRVEKQQNKVLLQSRQGFWARDGQAFINIRKILSGAQLEDIWIYEFDEHKRLVLATHAQRAQYAADGWELQGIEQAQISDQGVKTRKLDNARWASLLDPALLSVVVVKPTMLPIWGLSRYIDFMRSNGQSAIDYEVAYWLKVANPFATLVMLFLALPFILGNQRTSSVGQRIFLGAVVGAGFFLFNRGMSYTAVVYGINPALTAILPALVLVSITLLMLRRVR